MCLRRWVCVHLCVQVCLCFCIHPDIQGTWLSAVQWLWYHYDTWQIKNVWINRILLEATVAGSHSSEGGETVLCRNYGSLLVSNYAAWLASNYSFHISEVTITVKNYKQDYFFFKKKRQLSEWDESQTLTVLSTLQSALSAKAWMFL